MNNVVAVLSFAFVAFSASAEVTFPVECPELVVGDTWTYQWKDLKAQKDTEKRISIVEAKNPDGYVLNVLFEGGAKAPYKETRSLDFGVRSNVGGRDVVSHWIDFPLTPGKTWKEQRPWVNAGGGQGSDDITYAVQGIETITTPAGTFETVKVSGKGWWTNYSSRRSGQIDVYWYSRDTKFVVRYERKNLLRVPVTHTSEASSRHSR